MTRTAWIATALSVILGVSCNRSPPNDTRTLTLATTTSTENSGLLAHINPDFESSTGITVKVIAKGTGASIQLAKDGNADAILVHARAKEDEFIDQGFGVDRRDVMYNDFVIIGPASDPIGIRGMKNAAEALKKIAESQAEFVSRGDSSGTHFKEQELWVASGIPLLTDMRTIIKSGKESEISMRLPEGDWYQSIGQGMGGTLGFATEHQAYTLADRGTYYAYALGEQPRTDLVILVENDPRLGNPYGIIAVNPEKYPETNYDAATRYIQWITSPETQKKIGDFQIGGKQLFHPGAIE